MSGTHHRSCLGIFASVQFALWFRELKTRHAGSRLGWAWNLIGPVILVTVFTVIAGVHGKNLMYGIDYPMYVLTGWVPYHMSIHSLQLGMGAAKSNSGLFIYRQVKPFDVILARVLQTFIIDTIVLIVLVSVAGWVGYRIVPNDPLLLLVLWVAFGAFTLGLALCLAVLQHLSQEVEKIVSVLLRPLYIISGIFVPLSSLPKEFQNWMVWNPFLHYIEMIRAAWFATFPLDPSISWTMILWSALVAMFLGMISYQRYRLEISVG